MWNWSKALVIYLYIGLSPEEGMGGIRNSVEAPVSRLQNAIFTPINIAKGRPLGCHWEPKRVSFEWWVSLIPFAGVDRQIDYIFCFVEPATLTAEKITFIFLLGKKSPLSTGTWFSNVLYDSIIVNYCFPASSQIQLVFTKSLSLCYVSAIIFQSSLQIDFSGTSF